MNCITFEILRSGEKIPVEVDPVDASQGVSFGGTVHSLTPGEEREAQALLREANQRQYGPHDFGHGWNPVTREVIP